LAAAARGRESGTRSPVSAVTAASKILTSCDRRKSPTQRSSSPARRSFERETTMFF
jgi:hypothetical protein